MTKDKVFITWVTLVPVFSILMDLGMNFIPELKLVIGLVRITFLVGLVLFFLNSYPLYRTVLNQLILFFAIYLLAISLLSSNLKVSFVDGAIKTSIPFFMIPIGILASKMHKNLLIKPMIWVIIILLINYLFSQFYKLGVSIYEKDSFYKGGATASAPIIIALILIIIFHTFNKKKLPYNRIIITIIVSLALFVIIFSLKRGAILALISAALTYLFFTGKRTRTILRFVLVGLIMAFILNNNIESFYKRIESRTTERNELQNEGRYKEIFYIFQEFENSNPAKIIFGTEPFNSDEIMAKYFGRKRRLHVDYNILLHGTGIFGLSIYLMIFFNLLKTAIKLKLKSIKTTSEYSSKENFALVVSILILSLIMGFSGGLQFISYRVILFLAIGYYLGLSIYYKPNYLELKVN